MTKFKRHCAFIIRTGNYDAPSVFLENRPWLLHLRKYGVKVKVTIHKINDCGIYHSKQIILAGVNTFNGECRDRTGFTCRLKNAKASIPYSNHLKLAQILPNWFTAGAH